MEESGVLRLRGIFKRLTLLFCLTVCIITCFSFAALASTPENSKIRLTEEEQALVDRTQNEAPLSIGIIPHTFPLSDCPPDADGYVGINVEMISLISQVSGLRFEYVRIPIETETPYQMLQEGTVGLVAGTIKLDNFLKDPKVILSERLCDGSAACIAKRDTNPAAPTTGKIAVMKGYQAGMEFAGELFSTYEITPYPDNQSVIRAVREGTADLAIISRYVGIYELQSPLNEKLAELTIYNMEKDSCVMGVNTPENQLIISIVNKALSIIGEEGYNSMQMNFTLTNPYRLSAVEVLYKYRYILLVVLVAIAGFFAMTMRLLYAQKEHKLLSIDPLTGAYTEAGFELAFAKVLQKTSKPLFITDFDIYRFSSYNELNGKEKGDELLRDIVRIVKSFLCEQDVICRSYADHFKVLSIKDSKEDLIADIRVAICRFNEMSQNEIVLNFGIYPVTDITLSIPKMLDFAAMAKKQVKENPNVFIGIFDEELSMRYISEAKMISAFQSAIANKEFVPYFQPKFDAADKSVVGAEALVRWVTGDGTVIPPVKFIELFEKSGQIQQLDFYMLEQVCILLNSLKDKGMELMPVAVNFSRVHLYSDEFIDQVREIVDRYDIPKRFIEIECTETTMLNNIDLTRRILGDLQELGFSIAMDDFGSAYSSLNTLCSIPLDVIKLDGGFLSATISHEKDKAKIIISSVMRLAHDLSLKVVAEGVETQSQYDFLRGLGCDVIQGYYFSRPLDEQHFLELLTRTEASLTELDQEDNV